MNAQSLSSIFTPDLDLSIPLPRTGVQPLRIGISGFAAPQEGSANHVARHLASLGASIVAVAHPAPGALATAKQGARQTGAGPHRYADLPDMLAHEDLDAVAICSGVEMHREHLRAALDRSLHVLCEKPLLLETGRDPVADARPLVEGFAAAGQVLMLNEPWPYTLAAFDKLYPEARVQSRPPEHLAVLLCPCQPGLQMISSAVPHALSLLTALCPPRGTLERLRVESNDACEGVPTALTISFQYVHGNGRTNVSIDLCHTRQSPRPAGYSIDGRPVRRVVEMPGYQTYFVAQKSGRMPGDTRERPLRRVPIDDPLRLLLSDFLRRVQLAKSGGETDRLTDASLLERLGLLRTIYGVARSALAC